MGREYSTRGLFSFLHFIPSHKKQLVSLALHIAVFISSLSRNPALLALRNSVKDGSLPK